MQLAFEWLPAVQPAPQLLILLHGEASDGQAMQPLAQALRQAFSQAAIIAPDAPLATGEGRCWVDPSDGADSGTDGDPNDPDRMSSALPGLVDWVGATQRRLQVGPAATALAGFSQGATLALALAHRHDGLAGRVLAFGGRCPDSAPAAPDATTLHLLHGGADTVVPVHRAREALQRLGTLQGDATLDIAEAIGHELHPALIDSALFQLRNHIPYRTWRAALGGAAPRPDTHDQD